jgi:hypothetical protein
MFLIRLKCLTQPLFLSLVLILSLLSGCGDSGTATGEEQDLQERVLISLTDAEGDFTQYTVDVTALKLYRSNGAIVETLPNTTTLDFAQYVDVTEFLTAATVPVGSYSKAEITLDFTQAIVSVEDSLGNSIPASVVDDDGNALQTVTIEAQINSGSGFQIQRGVPASLSLDFDLEASNEVVIDSSGESATVTVNPILIANTSIDDEKTQRVRGLLTAVDTTENSFDIDIRPFRIRNRSYGNITVHTDAQTVCEINGDSYDADTGLTELNNLDLTTDIPMVVLGTFSHEQRRYLASEVFAGSSVPWNDKDILKGSVIARAENTLTVVGATIELDDGHFQFNDTVRVQIDDNTNVSKQGTTDSVNIVDLSVGQRVVILGEMTDDNNMNAAGETGLVRMRYSDISGTVNTVSPLEMDLQHVNRRNVSRYDFTGTGIDADNDANAVQYEIETSTLPLDSLQTNSPVKVRGFPNSFGSAPADFTAKTIINVGQVATKMFMSYGRNGSASAVTSLDENGLLLDLDSAVGRHHLKQAGIVTDIHDLDSVPFIVPSDGKALYTISAGRSGDVFTDWNNFQAELNDLLVKGHQVIFAHIWGQYDATTLDLTSRHVVIRMSK